MSREYFLGEEEKLFSRLSMLKELVGEQELRHKPCLLLASQLNELEVLNDKLRHDIIAMRKYVDSAISIGA